MRHDKTIAAVATPPGRGGVAVIRISGPGVPALMDTLFQGQLEPRHAYYRQLTDHTGECLDEVIALYFKAPHSFTGEACLELQGHGSPILTDLILKRLFELGVVPAEPGEFSLRAFLNEKLDLTQAEAIADLIQAQSQQAARMAMRSLQGDFSQTVNALVDQLLNLRLQVEAAIDFPEEEIDFLSELDVEAQLRAVLAQLLEVKRAARVGVWYNDGIQLVLLGEPNVGKSSLLNALSGQPLAIVTDVAGTTRDVIRQSVTIGGVPVHVVDTAGIRDTSDVVEQEGVRRAWAAVAEADLILLMLDAREGVEALTRSFHLSYPSHLRETIEQHTQGHVPVIIVYNKADLVDSHEQARLRQHVAQEDSEDRVVVLSVTQKQGLETLTDKVQACLGVMPSDAGEGNVMLARRRHVQALTLAEQHLNHALTQFKSHQAGELLAEDCRLAQEALGEITGRVTSDDLLGRIFSSFCIGK